MQRRRSGVKQEEVREKYDNPTGWLYVTLRNQIGNELQRAKYRNHSPLEVAENQPDKDGFVEKLEYTLPTELSDSDREILQMVFEQQMSYEEIAKKLGCSVLACRTRVYRAKKRVKALMDSNAEKALSNKQSEGGERNVFEA